MQCEIDTLSYAHSEIKVLSLHILHRHGMRRTSLKKQYVPILYTPYEGLNLANEKSRKLEIFDRKLEGNHYLFYSYFDDY